jgi:broad specificity phosphatase PhoE
MEQPPKENQIDSSENRLERYKELVQEILFVRHGATSYKEQFDKNFTGWSDLKEIGIKQAEEASAHVGDFINKDKPVKIFTSPRARTQNTAEIIKSKLEESDPSVEVKLSKAESLINTKTQGDAVDVWTSLMADYAKTGADMNKEYYSGELNEKHGDVIESPFEQSDRVKESFVKMLRIIRKREELDKDNENIVLVGHNETLNLLLQDHGKNLSENDFRIISTGEVAHMEIYPDYVIVKYGEQEYRLDM